MRLLLVEDHIGTGDALGYLFTTAGYVLNKALSYADAVRYLEESPPPSLIVSDHYLPDRVGTDLLEAVRKNKATKNVPFILTTAASDLDFPAIKERAEALGATRIVRKPYDVDEFLKVCREEVVRYLDDPARVSSPKGR